MRKLAILLFFFVSINTLAQNTNDLFSNANSLYKEGNYEEAIKLYEQIQSQNIASSELYYNLGNCYYKLNKVAPTIYNYEKALKLNPLNEDAKNNLVLAKRLTLDRIEALPKSVLQKFNENYLQKLAYNTWAIVTVIISFIASLFFLLFYFAYTPSKKRLYFTTSIIVGNIPIIIDLRKKVGHIQSEKASVIAGFIMILFLFVGQRLLNLIGIDVHSFAVAGSFL